MLMGSPPPLLPPLFVTFGLLVHTEAAAAGIPAVPPPLAILSSTLDCRRSIRRAGRTGGGGDVLAAPTEGPLLAAVVTGDLAFIVGATCCTGFKLAAFAAGVDFIGGASDGVGGKEPASDIWTSATSTTSVDTPPPF
jgi:hypothetical protein